MIHDFKKQAEPGIALAGNGLKSTVQVKRICPPPEKRVLAFFSFPRGKEEISARSLFSSDCIGWNSKAKGKLQSD